MRTFCLFLFLTFLICTSAVAQGTHNNILSGGYKFFSAGQSGSNTHGVFFAYDRLMFRGLLNLSVQPYWGLNRKSSGAVLAASYVVGANRKVNFTIGPQFQIWVQEDSYTNFYTRLNQEDPIISETHPTTKGAFLANAGFRVFVKNNFLFSTNLHVGSVLFDTYENRNPDADLKKARSFADDAFIGVNIGAGYRF
ncbi:MAG: hypothetical protein J7599_06500 [Niabella sp.]|nr:hypothetical protein [Niabella sp.]